MHCSSDLKTTEQKTSTCLDGPSSMKEIRQFSFGPRIDAVKTDYATLQIQLEEYSNQIFLHIDGFDKRNWSKEIFIDMLDVLDQLEENLKDEYGVEQLFVIIDAHDEKLIKFEMLFGFFPFFETTFFDSYSGEPNQYLIMFKELV